MGVGQGTGNLFSQEFELFCEFDFFCRSSVKFVKSEFCVLQSLLDDWLHNWLLDGEKKIVLFVLHIHY